MILTCFLLCCLHAQGAQVPSPTAPSSATRVHGRIIDQDARPLAGACLSIGRDRQRTQRQLLSEPDARSAEDGSFQLEVPLGDQLLLTAPGRLSCIVPLPAGSTGELGDLMLRPGSTWIGRVRGSDGKPLPDVTVVATDLLVPTSLGGQQGIRLQSVARSDRAGIFQLEGMPDDAMQLSFRAAGHVTQHLPICDRTTPLSVILPAAVACRGRLPDGVGKARVVARFANGKTEEAVTADDGTFVIWVPPARDYRVECTAASPPGHLVRSEILNGPQEQVVWKPAASSEGSLRVQVLREADGSKVAAFTVIPFWQHDHALHAGHMYGYSSREGVRGTDGEARLSPPGDWAPGKGILWVWADGCGEKFFDVDKPDGDEPIVLKLPAARRVTGKVQDAAGKPLANAEVWVVPMQPNSSLGYSYKPHNAVRTAADGSFEIVGLGPRNYSVQAFVSGRPTPVSVDVDLAAGEPAPMQFTIDDGTTVQLRVVGAARAPGWFAAVSGGNQGGGSANWSGGNDAQCRPILGEELHLRAASKNAKLQVFRLATGRVAHPIAFDVVAGEPVELASLRSGRLRGRLTVPAEVRSMLVVQAAGAVRYETTLGPDGSFDLELAPGSYQVGLRMLGNWAQIWSWDQRAEVAPEQPVELDLTPELAVLRIQLQRGAWLDEASAITLRHDTPNHRGTTESTLSIQETGMVAAVPVGRCQVAVRRYVDMLGGHTLRHDSEQVAEQTIETEAGKILTVELRDPGQGEPPRK